MVIKKWFKEPEIYKKTHFNVIKIWENNVCDDEIKEFLNKEILDSYRNLDFLKLQFKNENRSKLLEYLESYVFPNIEDGFWKIVWQWDFWEILSWIIVQYFQLLEVPIKKMRWKFNKDRSVFCTDMIAHNNWEKIENIYYYEIKTRQNISKKESTNWLNSYITVHAYNSLYKDQQNSINWIADFLSRSYYEKDDYVNSIKYWDLVKNPDTYNKNYEIFIIWETNTFKEDIITALEDISPDLKPLNVTIILIEWFKWLVDDLRDKILIDAEKIVYAK